MRGVTTKATRSPAIYILSPSTWCHLPCESWTRACKEGWWQNVKQKKKKRNSAPIFFFAFFSNCFFLPLLLFRTCDVACHLQEANNTETVANTSLKNEKGKRVFLFFFLLSKWLHVSLSLSDKRGSWHLKCVMTKKSCTLAVLWAVTSWTRDDVACMTWWWESSWALWKGTRNYIHCRCTPMTLLLLFSFQLNMNWERKKKINNEKKGRGILPLWK